MNDHQQTISRFYTAFQQLDYKVMQECYREDAIFVDPVFDQLNTTELKAMWEMLCTSAKDFSLEFSNVETDGDYGTCNWVAKYTFSQTGRRVINNVKANFKFKDGQIAEHNDYFDFWKWSRQALGLPGWLLGWNEALHKKVRTKARSSLEMFMGRSEGR